MDASTAWKTLTQLVYLSRAEGLFSRADLIDILSVARQNNARLGVTGMLVCVEGAFLQVLEGPSDSVMALCDRIKSDPRHGQVVVLVQEEIKERAFGDWSMGAVWSSWEDLKGLPGSNDIFAGASCLNDVQAGTAKALLQSSRRNLSLIANAA